LEIKYVNDDDDDDIMYFMNGILHLQNQIWTAYSVDFTSTTEARFSAPNSTLLSVRWMRLGKKLVAQFKKKPSGQRTQVMGLTVHVYW